MTTSATVYQFLSLCLLYPQADLLPRYLQNLSQEPLLQGLQLQVFQLNRSEDKTRSRRSGAFDFLVATSDTGEDKP